MPTFFHLLSVHGGKGIRLTANEDTPPEKGTCQQCYVKPACPPEQPTAAQTSVWSNCHEAKITRDSEQCRPLGAASTLSPTPPFYFPVWAPLYRLSQKQRDSCKGLFVVDEASYICRQKDDVQNRVPGESLNVKAAVSWDEGERGMCETRWIKERVVHRSCQLMKRSFSPETLDFFSFLLLFPPAAVKC